MTGDMIKRSWATTPRWAKWVLCLSLVVNFVILGLGAGAAMKWREHGHRHGGVASIGQIMHALPDERRSSARELLRAAKPQLTSIREERRDAHQALAAAIGATPFDSAATTTAFDTLRDRDNLAKAEAHRVMVEVLSLLTDEERAEVAERLKKRGRHKDR